MGFRLQTDSRLWLSLGFLSIAVAVVVGYLTPATGYELSIYASTPLLFWAGTVGALVLSVLLVFSKLDGPSRSLGAVLGGLSMFTIMSTPIIRGYHYMGPTDSLSHLGTTRDINQGTYDLMASRYPAVHTLGSMLADVTGSTLEHSLLIVVVVFILCFFVFIPLVIRALTNDSRLAYIGLFAGLLLLPLNHISPSTYIHPTSQALMFAPVILFAFLLVYTGRSRSYSVLFMFVSTMFVMLHLQQAANLVVFFGTIAVLQVIHARRTGQRAPAGRRPVYSLVFVFGLLFWLWVQRVEAFWSAVAATIVVPFTDTTAAETTATRNVSLEAVGGSLPEVFLKLFSVQLAFSVFAAILMGAVVLRVIEFPLLASLQQVFTTDSSTERTLLVYFSGGFVAIFSVFGIYLVGGISDQYFRHIGTIMVLVTVLGTIAIGRAALYVGRRTSARTARLGTAGLLIVVLLVSVPVAFSSPYFYNPSDQVTEQQMQGYETTFEHQASDVLFTEVRSSTSRYGNAIQGRSIPEDAYYVEDDEVGVPDHFANQSLRTEYDERIYLPVTEADRTRDPILWQGFRFSHDDFRYLDAEPGINNVQSNGGYDLYLVHPDDTADIDEATDIEEIDDGGETDDDADDVDADDAEDQGDEVDDTGDDDTEEQDDEADDADDADDAEEEQDNEANDADDADDAEEEQDDEANDAGDDDAEEEQEDEADDAGDDDAEEEQDEEADDADDADDAEEEQDEEADDAGDDDADDAEEQDEEADDADDADDAEEQDDEADDVDDTEEADDTDTESTTNVL